MGFFSQHDAVETTTSGLHVENVRADKPEFKRLYTVQLNQRAFMKVDIHTSLGHRWTSGELSQPNGRWILFEPERVADKILDPVLVPIIERYVAEIFALDKTFMASNPGEYIDDGGCRWRRIE
jgi:hypothetical protein